MNGLGSVTNGTWFSRRSSRLRRPVHPVCHCLRAGESNPVWHRLEARDSNPVWHRLEARDSNPVWHRLPAGGFTGKMPVPHGFQRAGRGLALVEALVSIVIVGTMLAVAIGLVGSTAHARLIQAEESHGAALAKQLMTEILQCRYEEPETVTIYTIDDGEGNTTTLGTLWQFPDTSVFGPEPGEATGTRVEFDDVDDHDGWSASPPQNKDGTPHGDHVGWTREVAVAFVDPADPSSVTVDDQDLKRITVTVTDPGGKQTTLVALRSESSFYDELPDVTTTYLNWAGIVLQIGSDPRGKIDTGINLENQVEVGAGGI